MYLELLGGRQQGLGINETTTHTQNAAEFKERQYREPRSFPVSDKEKEKFDKFLEKIKDSLWKKIN